MSVKIVLTQIMKNESHVAERMLNSIKNFVDGVVVVDTGSTDNSIEIVENWGKENNIETYVVSRAFDNFENSRNFSIDTAREKFLSKNDGNTYYGMWLDFDEQLVVHPNFNKEKCDKDLYMFNTSIGAMKYTRNEFYRLDKEFKFYGPVHEFIIYSGKDQVTSGLMEGVEVLVKMDGGSWKSDISEKYKGHAVILEDYINRINRDPRWIFYTAQSYHDSASVPNNREENEERWRRAMKYYKERVDRLDGYEEERYYSQLRIGSIMKMMEFPWEQTHQSLLKAYSMDPLRAESIKLIVDHYLSIGEWNMAYMYSKFLKVNFFNKNPYPQRLLFIDESLYTWKILESHAAACFYCGKADESKANYQELLLVMKRSPQLFTPEDVQKINANAQFFK
jgi:glycosyltransferase involved in cell wall biosynthesis